MVWSDLGKKAKKHLNWNILKNKKIIRNDKRNKKIKKQRKIDLKKQRKIEERNKERKKQKKNEYLEETNLPFSLDWHAFIMDKPSVRRTVIWSDLGKEAKKAFEIKLFFREKIENKK